MIAKREDPGARTVTGWPFEGKERQDFLHRPRQFPAAVMAWRKRLLDGKSTSSEFVDDLDRDTVDRFATTMRELDRLLAIMHRLDPEEELGGAFPVSADALRVLSRVGVHQQLGLELEGLKRAQAERALADLIPPPLRQSLHSSLKDHGRSVCKKAKPGCHTCEIARFCRKHRMEAATEASSSDAPTVVDLFCGAGGLSRGFDRAGCRTLVAADMNESALRTYRLNRPSVPDDQVLEVDLEDIEPGRLLDLAGGASPDILIAAPPCQGFSQAGHRSRGSANGYQSTHDDRNYLYECVAVAAAELKPRLILLENVPGMKSAKQMKRSFIEHAAERIEEETGYAYKTAIWRLNATEFGVPQNRTRYFIVGWRHDHVAPAMPAADYQDRSSREYDLDALPPVTLAEAIFDLPPLAPGAGAAVAPREPSRDDRRARRYLKKFGMLKGSVLFNHSVRYHNARDIELYGLLQPGEDSVHAIERYGRKDLMRYRTDVFDDKYSRLRPDKPSKTIVAHLAKDGNGYVHPEQARSISLREAARVQSFEDDYVFCGSPSQQWVQLGNSVPPVMAEAIAKSFRRAMEVEDSK